MSQPTNSEILKEVKRVGTMYETLERRVTPLEDWKRNEDAYRAALAKVKDEDAAEKREKRSETDHARRTEIMKQVGIVLGLIIAILYAYMATKGIQP